MICCHKAADKESNKFHHQWQVFYEINNGLRADLRSCYQLRTDLETLANNASNSNGEGSIISTREVEQASSEVNVPPSRISILSINPVLALPVQPLLAFSGC